MSLIISRVSDVCSYIEAGGLSVQQHHPKTTIVTQVVKAPVAQDLQAVISGQHANICGCTDPEYWGLVAWSPCMYMPRLSSKEETEKKVQR